MMIATLFGKKKITEDKLANVFVNTVLEMGSEGFATVAAEVNEAPEFETPPSLDARDDQRFLLIALAGNLTEMQRTLGPGLDKRMFSLSVSKFAQAIGRGCSEVETDVKALQSRMERMNHPSKNTVLAMARALFAEYDLYEHQDSYFKGMRQPNPIVLKRITGLFNYFLFNWSEVNEQYRIG